MCRGLALRGHSGHAFRLHSVLPSFVKSKAVWMIQMVVLFAGRWSLSQVLLCHCILHIDKSDTFPGKAKMHPFYLLTQGFFICPSANQHQTENNYSEIQDIEMRERVVAMGVSVAWQPSVYGPCHCSCVWRTGPAPLIAAPSSLKELVLRHHDDMP